MSTQNTIKISICCLVPLVITLPFMGFSDGVLFKTTKDSPYLSLVRENKQVAYINYEEGIQHMIISVVAGFESGKEEDIKDTVWIFPLPAKPEDVSIDIVKDFKMFHEGINIGNKVMENMRWWAGLTFTSQVFPTPLLLLFPLLRPRSMELKGSGISLDVSSNITEYMSVQKMGLITKVITATDGNALYDYIKERGADIPEEAKKTFQAYIGKHYSFVVTWIENLDEYLKNIGSINKKIGYSNHTLQVYVKFKTDEIYYPMLLTSLYGQEIIEISLYFTKPVVFSSGGEKNLSYFYLKNKHKVSPEYTSFYGGKEYYGNCVYTLYTQVNYASDMKNDLWFKIGKPNNLDRNISFIRYFWILFILCYVLFSVISSFLAGHIVFVKEIRPSHKRLLMLGLFNCLTLIGLVFAGNRIFRKDIPVELTELESELKKQGFTISINSGRKFYIWFSFIFMFFMLGSAFILRKFLF